MLPANRKSVKENAPIKQTALSEAFRRLSPSKYMTALLSPLIDERKTEARSVKHFSTIMTLIKNKHYSMLDFLHEHKVRLFYYYQTKTEYCDVLTETIRCGDLPLLTKMLRPVANGGYGMHPNRTQMEVYFQSMQLNNLWQAATLFIQDCDNTQKTTLGKLLLAEKEYELFAKLELVKKNKVAPTKSVGVIGEQFKSSSPFCFFMPDVLALSYDELREEVTRDKALFTAQFEVLNSIPSESRHQAMRAMLGTDTFKDHLTQKFERTKQVLVSNMTNDEIFYATTKALLQDVILATSLMYPKQMLIQLEKMFTLPINTLNLILAPVKNALEKGLMIYGNAFLSQPTIAKPYTDAIAHMLSDAHLLVKQHEDLEDATFSPSMLRFR